MTALFKIFFALLALAAIGGVIVLSTIRIPAPIATVQKALPDDQFPH